MDKWKQETRVLGTVTIEGDVRVKGPKAYDSFLAEPVPVQIVR